MIIVYVMTGVDFAPVNWQIDSPRRETSGDYLMHQEIWDFQDLAYYFRILVHFMGKGASGELGR